jgi:hypothetical protein
MDQFTTSAKQLDILEGLRDYFGCIDRNLYEHPEILTALYMRLSHKQVLTILPKIIRDNLFYLDLPFSNITVLFVSRKRVLTSANTVIIELNRIENKVFK